MENTKLTPEEIIDQLRNFYGSENYYIFNPICKNVLLTDGAHFLAEKAEVYWLMDMIASHIPSIKDDWFAVAIITTDDKGNGIFKLEDGNYNKIVEQKNFTSSFPFKDFKLFVEKSEDTWVILLPGEH